MSVIVSVGRAAVKFPVDLWPNFVVKSKFRFLLKSLHGHSIIHVL
jgi:hypothetical protein